MKLFRIFSLLAINILILLFSIHAVAQIGEKADVISGGGELQQSTSYVLTSTVGETFIGQSANNNYVSFVGFWYLTTQENTNLLSILDPNFEQALIDLGIDGDGLINQQILKSEAEAVTSLNVAGKQIANLTGIEGFINLTSLDCGNNLLVEINLESNTSLTSLNCHTNQLTTLDVSNNTDLQTLICSNNMLTELDVVQLNELGYLDCHDNAISYLELDHSPLLYHLRCSKNQFQELYVEHNPALHTLDFSQNQVQEIALYDNVELTQLFCKSNQLYDLILTGNPKLFKLECTGNNLDALDLSNNPLLTQVFCSLNELPALDVAHLANMERLHCGHNQITDLDLQNNQQLYQLECDDNNLATLDLRNGANDLITSLNVTNNSNLTCISVDDELADHSAWTIDAGTILSNDCGYNTQRGDIVKVRPEVNMPSRLAIDVEFENVSRSGHTTMTQTIGVEDPTGLTFPQDQEVYNIETTAEYSGDITLIFDYSELQYDNEEGLQLLHYHNNQWEDITTNIDVDNDQIHGITSSLSPFVIYESGTGEVVTLLNSQGEGLPGGTVKYYAKGWKSVEGATDEYGELVVDLPEDIVPTAWKMYYAGASLQQNNASTPITFQTVNVSVDLLSSTESQLIPDNIKYYASGWKQFGDEANTNNMELLLGNYSFKVYYKGGSNQKSHDVGVDPHVVFETVNVSMDLMSSTGEPLASDNAKYYASGWKQFGNDVNGTNMELLPNSYSFKVYYKGGSKQKSQDVSENGNVVFETVNVAMNLLSSTGETLASDNAKYYASGWKQFGDGITSASMELLPNNYSFKVYYKGGSNQKSQDVGTDPNIVFETGLVSMQLVSSTGGSLVSDDAKYYAGGWKTFGSGQTATSMELLPNKYSFKVYHAGGFNQTSQQVGDRSIVEFMTTEVTMKLHVDGVPQASTDARYYANGWKTFGTGITETSMELLPNNYAFKVYFDGTSEQMDQDIGVNPVVAFDVSSSNARIANNNSGNSERLFANEQIAIFPNPVKDILTIELLKKDMADGQSINIHLFNMTGADMMENHTYSLVKNRLTINVNYLPAGIYTLVIPNNKKIYKHKLIKL